MQAITTKYYGPGNVRGSRIIAKTASGAKRSFHYDHALSAENNHRNAACELAKQMQWEGLWIEGGLDNAGNVYVCLGQHDTRTFTV